MAGQIKYKEVLKDKEYRKLLCSNLINRFGDSVDAIAFTWLVYQITHSASWAALIFGLNILPNIFVQPLVGPFVEKMDKKKIIIFTHIARALVISAFVLMYMTGFANPYLMAAFTLLITTIESFNLPAAGAFVPQVIKKENLAHAMSLNSSLSSAVQLVGTGVAGVIIARFGVQTAMIIDVITFYVAAMLIVSIKTRQQESASQEVTVIEEANSNQTDAAREMNTSSDKTADAAGKEKESYLSMLKDGFKYCSSNRVLINFGIMAIFINFLLVPLNSLEAPIAEDVYGLGSSLLSVMGMTASLGGILGSIVTPMIMEKMASKKIVIVFGTIMGGFLYALSLGQYLKGAALPGYLLAGICYFMMSASASVIGSAVSIQFVKFCRQDYLARAGAVMGATSTAAMPLASILVSVLAVRFSPAVLIAGCGIVAVVFMAIIGLSNMDFDLVKKETPDAAKAIG